MLKTLTNDLGQDEPTLGRLLLPPRAAADGSAEWAGGTISVGDEVRAH